MNSIDNKILDIKKLIKENPLNFNLRIELVQYYCLKGFWKDALKLLDSYCILNPSDNQTKKLFQNNIKCEIERLSVFNHESVASSINKYGFDICKKQYEFLRNISVFDQNISLDLFEFMSNYNNKKFNILLNDNRLLNGLISDTDHRVCNIFEVFVEENYKWVALNSIQKIEFYESEYVVDLIWRRAIMTLSENEKIPCFIPVRYSFTDNEGSDDSLICSKRTIWKATDSGFLVGSGQKTYVLNNEIDFAILDIKKMECSN